MEFAFAFFKLLFFFFLFFVLRVSRLPYQPHRVLRRFRRICGDLIAHHGGAAYNTGRRRIVYLPHEGREIEVDCSGRPRLTIRIREPFPFSVSLNRVPRLVYAFAESFVPENMRIHGHPYFVTGDVESLNKRPAFMPLFEQFSQAGFSVHIRADMLVLVKRVRRSDLHELLLQDWLKQAGHLAAVCAGEPLTIPVQPVDSELCCAYCKETIELQSEVSTCASCSTSHHSDCFALNGRCSVYGCGSKSTAQQAGLVSMPEVT